MKKMKKILYFFVSLLVLNTACSEVDDMQYDHRAGVLESFAVVAGGSHYHGRIDHYAATVEIGAIVNLDAITEVKYTLANPEAVIMPDPATFIGNWQKEQDIVVYDNGVETKYTIVFTRYDESEEPENPDDPNEPENPDAPDLPEGVIFFEDFDSGSIPDASVWKLCTKGTTSSAWTYYFDDGAGYRNVKIEDGCLVLTADKDGRYRNGGIRTVKGFPCGTLVEVRAKFGKAGGGFPAIWQMPVGGLQWPKSGEIDLMDWVRSSPNLLFHSIHTYGGETQNDKSTYKTSQMANTNEFHVYAASRTEEAVTFYLDGNEIWSYENQNLGGDEGFYQYPFANYDFDIILNYSVCDFGWPSQIYENGKTVVLPINDTELPVVMQVDWVKVSKFPADEEGGDEEEE